MTISREHESKRIETFSDATFAFAAALLVVILQVPRSFAEREPTVGGVVPLALGFAALYAVWAAHTGFFRRYALGDTYTIVVNGVLLFTVLFSVYPLKFTAAHLVNVLGGTTDIAPSDSQPATLYIIFGLVWSLTFLCFALLYSHANTRRDHLELTPVSAYDAITYSRYYLTLVATGLISLILAGFGIGVEYGLPAFAYLIAIALAFWNRSQRRHGRSHLAESVAEHPQLANTAAIRTKDIIEGVH